MPTIQIRDLGQLSAKFARRAAAAAPDLETGVRTTAKDQAAEAIAAAPRWQQAVSDPKAQDRFKAQLSKAGTEKWRANTIKKAVTDGRYAGGVRDAAPAWQAGFAPIAAALQGLQLTRGLRRSAQNFDNVRIVAEAAAKAAGKA